MTYARKSLVSLNDTPYYHCIARCVRRAWLWGVDEYAGKDYSHRKVWVINRLRHLTRAFAVDVCAYAVMSNHYHLVVHVDRQRAREWTDGDVLRRWKLLFGWPALVQRYHAGDVLSRAERAAVAQLVGCWRERLHDVSWFMRALNEHLARKANAEDGCTGRFWEGRFKSQALLDEAGLLTAMAYVDLNPIRVGIARTPETSEFTSIHQRIREVRSAPRAHPRVGLMRFKRPHNSGKVIPFSLESYIELVDWSGRSIQAGRGGHIHGQLPPILQRLKIDPAMWSYSMQESSSVFGRALGRLDHLRQHAEQLRQRWIRGMGQCTQLYGG